MARSKFQNNQLNVSCYYHTRPVTMTSEYDRRVAIFVALEAGSTPAEIGDFLKLKKATVYRVAKAFHGAGSAGEAEKKDLVSPARKIHDRSSARKRSRDFLDELQTAIDSDPSISMRALATRMNVSNDTIFKAIHEDLWYKSYVFKVRQHLSEEMKAKRVAKCALLLASLKHAASGRVRFFSDEKIFCIDQKVNRRNDRWLAKDPEDVPVVGRRKYPASAHVLLVVSSKGDVMPLHFFEKGEKVNKEVYLNVLQTVVKPWMDETAGETPYVFQQDGTPAHTSHLVQNWLSDNLDLFWTKHFWPPNSPDLNPLDYYVWGVLERDSNKSSHQTVEELKAAIRRAVERMDRTHLINACTRFRARVESVIECDGSWIE